MKLQFDNGKDCGVVNAGAVVVAAALDVFLVVVAAAVFAAVVVVDFGEFLDSFASVFVGAGAVLSAVLSDAVSDICAKVVSKLACPMPPRPMLSCVPPESGEIFISSTKILPFQNQLDTQPPKDEKAFITAAVLSLILFPKLVAALINLP